MEKYKGMIYWFYRLINVIKSKLYYPKGTFTFSYDRNGKPLHVGDIVCCKGKSGIVLRNTVQEEYQVFYLYSKFYRGGIYNQYSYGKSYTLQEVDRRHNGKNDVDLVSKWI